SLPEETRPLGSDVVERDEDLTELSLKRGAVRAMEMEYVNFGSSGLRVSRLALGMGLRGQGDEGEAERLIRRAFDGGVNLFDCANVYGLMDDRAYAGRSEEILGRALRGVRDDVVITSKVFSPIGSG